MPLKKKFRLESIAKARIDIGKDDIDDAYMDVNYAISRDTNYTLKEFKKESMSTKQLLEAAFKVGDKVGVTDRDMMTYYSTGIIHSIKGNEYFVKFKDDVAGTTLIPHTANQLKLIKESMSTKQLVEAANRKCEMRWKVLAFNPAEDNKLVKEFKDFDCIDCAVAKKREYLEKNPTHIVEVISESKAQKNEDLSSKIKSLFKDKESEIDSTGKYNGRIKALDDYSYAVWLRGNDAEYDSPVAKFLRTKGFTVDNKFHFLPFERGAKVYILESKAQKNEEVTKSNYKSIINELESIFKKFAGNGLELGHKIKPNSFDLPFDTSLSVALKDKAKLEPVKAALKKVIDKYGAKKVAHDNDFAYNFGKSNRDGIYVGFNWNATSAFVGYAVNPDFDVKALSESSQKNETKLTDKEKQLAKQLGIEVKKSLTYQEVHSPNFKPRKGNFISLNKLKDGTFEATISTDAGAWHNYGDKTYPDLKTAYDAVKRAYSYPVVVYESAQMNEASSLQALNKELANNVENLYLMAKHVRDRFKYRTLQNMSYDEAQAEKIYDQIEAVIEDAVKKLTTINSKVIG